MVGRHHSISVSSLSRGEEPKKNEVDESSMTVVRIKRRPLGSQVRNQSSTAQHSRRSTSPPTPPEECDVVTSSMYSVHECDELSECDVMTSSMYSARTVVSIKFLCSSRVQPTDCESARERRGGRRWWNGVLRPSYISEGQWRSTTHQSMTHQYDSSV